jgi:hypothetical protein
VGDAPFGCSDKAVLYALANWLSFAKPDTDELRCYPAVSSVARAAGLKSRAVQLSFKRLADAGVLTYDLYSRGGLHATHRLRLRGASS